MLIKDDYDSLYAFCLPKTLPSQRILVSDIKTKDLLEQPISEIADEISSHLNPHLKGYKNIYMLITGSLYMVPLEKSILSNNKDLKKLLSDDTGIKNLSKNKDSEYEDYDAIIIIGEDYLEFE